MGKKKKTIVRVVMDTNVLVSALLFKGELSKIVDLWKKGRIIPVFSRATFQEFKIVLACPKFALSNEEIEAILEEEVFPFFEVVDMKEEVRGVCRDADDDKFLSCAISASAECIVSGDKGLLDLRQFRSIKILNPSDFINRFAKAFF